MLQAKTGRAKRKLSLASDDETVDHADIESFQSSKKSSSAAFGTMKCKHIFQSKQ